LVFWTFWNQKSPKSAALEQNQQICFLRFDAEAWKSARQTLRFDAKCCLESTRFSTGASWNLIQKNQCLPAQIIAESLVERFCLFQNHESL
jgi:hypothetical protein